MSVTTTTAGSNSAYITYTAGETIANIFPVVETYITAHGWSVWDSSAATNARCYRAPTADTAQYKYIVLDFNTTNQLYIKVWEAWNTTTHSGTNMAYQSDAAAQGQRRES